MENIWLFSLAHVPSAYMEEAGFMAYIATSHQGAMIWFRFWGAVMSSDFMYSLLYLHTEEFLLPFPLGGKGYSLKQSFIFILSDRVVRHEI